VRFVSSGTTSTFVTPWNRGLRGPGHHGPGFRGVGDPEVGLGVVLGADLGAVDTFVEGLLVTLGLA
jgi:hypothetical protein